MMEIAHVDRLYLAYAAYVIAAASPGPSNMAIMGAAMSRGRGAALALTAGVVTGSWTWAVLAATGIAAVLSTYAQALLYITIAGGLYLLHLALKAARSAMAPAPAKVTALAEDRRPEFHSLYRRGLLLHVGNPKAILGWVATMSLGLQPGGPPYMPFAILLGCAVLSVVIFGGYAMLFSTPAMARAYRKARRWIEGTLAVFFGAAGLRLLWS
jgi:threonine/homoserine/homoserine lactone efflux protein